MNEELIKLITSAVYKELNKGNGIPIGVSNRHVHLSQKDLQTLFGKDAYLNMLRDLSQPGQYACEETVTLVGPKGVIKKVRVLGPLRGETQVEIAVSDCFKLGIKAPIRDSGVTKGSAGVTLVGTNGAVTLKEGCIVAARHIHMHTLDAQKFGVKDGDKVNVKTSGLRAVVFLDALVRVSDKYRLEMHIDIDEANAASLNNGDIVNIIQL